MWLVASAFSLLIVALVVAMGARADESGPDARVLGVTEGLLTYCETRDPKAAAEYRERLEVLTHGASEAALARLRDGDVYRKARESLDDFVGKVDEHNAKRVCTNGLHSKSSGSSAHNDRAPASDGNAPVNDGGHAAQ